MNFLKSQKKPDLLNEEIERLLEEMTTLSPSSQDYAATNDQLLKLYKLHAETTAKKHVSPDGLLSAAAGLLGIVVVITFEYAHPLNTKAWSFIKLGK